jgi:hypothetical protein
MNHAELELCYFYKHLPYFGNSYDTGKDVQIKLVTTND